MSYDLDFEQELAEAAHKIRGLQQECNDQASQRRLEEAIHDLHARTKEIYAHLTSWQTVQVARHKDRPYAADYMSLMCDDFLELHGDRAFADDHAILAGLGKLAGNTVMFVCQQKGREMQEKQYHNFGMPHPEGYRKAYRLMSLAEKFGVPLVCLIDTPGAFPGLEDEEHGQSGESVGGRVEQSSTPNARAECGERERAGQRADADESEQQSIPTRAGVQHVACDHRHHRQVLEAEDRVNPDHAHQSCH